MLASPSAPGKTAPGRPFLEPVRATAATPYASFWMSPNRAARQGTYVFGSHADCERCRALYVGPAGYAVCLSAHKTLATAQANALASARRRQRQYRALPAAGIACRGAAQWLVIDAAGQASLDADHAGLDLQISRGG